MEEKDEILFIHEMPCFLLDPENAMHCKTYSVGSGFNISKMPTKGLQNEWKEFISSRAAKCTLYTICGERTKYNNLCLFFGQAYPNLEHVTDIAWEEMLKNLKKWALKNGIKFSYVPRKKTYRGNASPENPLFRYLRTMYFFHKDKDSSTPETEKDIWNVDRLEFKVDINPVHRLKTISFVGIKNLSMREEAKKVIETALHMYSLIYVSRMIAAMNRFSEYLDDRTNILSFLDVNRKTIEDFLIYYNTEYPNIKSNTDQVYGMKAFYYILSEMSGKEELQMLFMNGDVTKRIKSVYKVYSDRETQALNRCFKQLEPQYYRAILIHQLLGTRISETLMLRQNCVKKDNHGWFISIYQNKTRKWYRKPASDTVIGLINESIAYTTSHYGECEYVFVSPKNPKRPMSYAILSDRMKKVIFENDLRDDNGQLFGVNTHFFRHAFGKRLTEKHIDDLTISKLLGHSGTSSVKYYRQISNLQLAKETKAVRDRMDNVIDEIIKDWDDYDEI